MTRRVNKLEDPLLAHSTTSLRSSKIKPKARVQSLLLRRAKAHHFEESGDSIRVFIGINFK